MKKGLLLLVFLSCFIAKIFANESLYDKINVLSVDNTFQSYYPIERYALYSSYNYGITTQLNMKIDPSDSLRLFTAVTLSNNIPVKETIKNIIDLYLVAGLSWRFNLDNIMPFKGLSVSPGFGYGWMPHFTYGSYWSKGSDSFQIFHDQIILFEIEFAYNLKHLRSNWDYTLLLTPSFVQFLEDEYNGQEFGFNIGLRRPLDKKNKTTYSKPEIEVTPLNTTVIIDNTPPGFTGNDDQTITNITTNTSIVNIDPVDDESSSINNILYNITIKDEDNKIVFNKSFKDINNLEITGLKPDNRYKSELYAADESDNRIFYNDTVFKTLPVVSKDTFNLGDNAIEVDLRKTLVVEFNNDIKPETILSKNIYVKSGNKLITGELKYNDKILEFVPMQNFLQGEIHSFVLSTGIEDIYGNRLDEDLEFTFKALDYNDIFAHWKFDNNTLDSSGNDHTATLKSVRTDKMPEFVEIDKNGNSGLHFVGGYNWGTYIDLGTIDMKDQFTIAGWVYIERPPEQYSQKIMTLISNGDAGAVKDGFKVFFNNWNRDDRRIVIETGNKTENKNSETQENFTEYDNWYHVAVVIDRTKGIVKLYFNGKEAATTNGGSILKDFNTNAPLHIAHFKDGYFHYNGYIDDFRIYKKIISAENIEIIARGR